MGRREEGRARRVHLVAQLGSDGSQAKVRQVSKHSIQEGPLHAVCLGGRSPTAHTVFLRLHLI